MSFFWHLIHRLDEASNESVAYSSPHFGVLGLIGFLGFPLYYRVWCSWFPQPYENLSLRVIGSILFLGLFLVKYWPKRDRLFLRIYWLVTVTYGMPFFFTYMLLMNDANLVWSMSMMAGLTLLVRVAYDWVLVTCLFILGSLLACSVYVLTTENYSLHNYWTQVPVYLFIVIVGGVFNYTSAIARQAKLKILASVGAEIAHELRTPLLTIDFKSQQLLELLRSYLPTEQHSLLDQNIGVIQREVGYANTVIDMLLMDLNTQKISQQNISSIDVNSLVNTAIDRYPFRSEKEAKKVSFDSDERFLIEGSDVLVTHVLFNLIKNALAYLGEDGVITITSSSSEKANYLLVKDTGKGIAAKQLPYIFDDFYTMSEQGKGTGVGLSFCQKVMNELSGRISCESVEGEYTLFTLEFPLVDQSPSLTVKTDENSLLGRSILVIDDQLLVCQPLIDALEAAGCKVSTADNGHDGLSRLQNESFDLLVVDLSMPGISGVDTILEVRAFSRLGVSASVEERICSPFFPIIAFSAEPPETASPRALAAGATAFVSKSELVDDVLSTIASSLCLSDHQKNMAGSTILLVDDQVINHHIVKNALAAYSLTILEASDAKEAMDLLEVHHCDVVLMDIHMPVTNGFELAQMIRATLPNGDRLPMIGLSGDPRENILSRCREVGISVCLRKPLNSQQLVVTLSEALQVSRLEAPLKVNIDHSSHCHNSDSKTTLSRVCDDDVHYQCLAKLIHDIATPVATLNLCESLIISNGDVSNNDVSIKELLINEPPINELPIKEPSNNIGQKSIQLVTYTGIEDADQYHEPAVIFAQLLVLANGIQDLLNDSWGTLTALRSDLQPQPQSAAVYQQLLGDLSTKRQELLKDSDRLVQCFPKLGLSDLNSTVEKPDERLDSPWFLGVKASQKIEQLLMNYVEAKDSSVKEFHIN